MNTSHFVAVYSGNHRYIQDYLTDEVLRELPEITRTFLFQTCILEHLNSSLCNAVTGQDNSQVMLELLERINLFLVPLDNYRHWYRYHRLFRDFLYEYLQHLPQEQIRVLHRRAYEWYEKNAFKAEAVYHALAAMDNEYAAKLIARFGEEMVRRNEIVIVRQWLEGLPIDVIRSRPRLCLLQAWTLIAANQSDDVEVWMQEARNGLSKEDCELLVDSSCQSAAEGRQAKQVMLEEILVLQSRIASLKACTGDTTNSRRDCYSKVTSSLSEQLSQREIEVVQLLAAGISIGEIAQQLTLAESTVKWYIKSIYSKLDVHSRAQLIIRVRDLGIAARE
jgi:ATP/maltotriose-dependent transcriptional regulator MalT